MGGVVPAAKLRHGGHAVEGHVLHPLGHLLHGAAAHKVLETCYAKPNPGGKNFSGFMDGLSLHYYVVPGDWEHKGPVEDVQAHRRHQSVPHGVLLVEEARVRPRLHIEPVAPLVCEVPALQESVSVREDGTVLVTLANLSVRRPGW